MVDMLKSTMQWTFPAALTLLVLAAVSGWAADLKDDPASFDGVRWGTSALELSGLTLIREQADFRTFTRLGVPPSVCDITPERIKYQFFKDRLNLVIVSYRGKETHETLVACALRRYGPIPPMKPRKLLRVDWEGPATIVSLTYDPYTEEGTLSFSSRSINEELFESLELTPHR
jgi:hypothetical protein